MKSFVFISILFLFLSPNICLAEQGLLHNIKSFFGISSAKKPASISKIKKSTSNPKAEKIYRKTQSQSKKQSRAQKQSKSKKQSPFSKKQISQSPLDIGLNSQYKTENIPSVKKDIQKALDGFMAVCAEDIASTSDLKKINLFYKKLTEARVQIERLQQQPIIRIDEQFRIEEISYSIQEDNFQATAIKKTSLDIQKDLMTGFKSYYIYRTGLDRSKQNYDLNDLENYMPWAQKIIKSISCINPDSNLDLNLR